MVPASPGHTLPFCKPEGLQLGLSPPPLQKHTVSAGGFWDWILHDAQSQFLKLASQGDMARPACCLLPLPSPPPFPLLLELNRIFTLAPTPAAAEKSYWNHSSSKRQAGLKRILNQGKLISFLDSKEAAKWNTAHVFQLQWRIKAAITRLFLNLRASRPRLKMYKIALGSELKAKHATKNQANFQGPFLASPSEGINPKCRLRQENQEELMKQHVWDIFILPGHLRLFESNRVV